MSIHKFFRILTMSVAVLITPLFAFADTAMPLDKVVAIVNNSVITQSQLDDNIDIIKQQLQATGQPIPSAAELRKKALDQAIGQTLQLQVAQRVKIVVTDADVTAAINKIAEQNHLTLEQLKDTLVKEGMNYATFRARIHDQMLLHQVQQQALAGKVQVTNADVKAYMKRAPALSDNAQYHLEDLLIPLSDTATQSEKDAVTKQATELLQKARAGTSLNELAQQAPPANTLQYTDLQWRAANQLPDIFITPVKTLKAGDISGPITAPNGLHIVRLIEVNSQAKPLTEAQAKQMVLQEKVQKQADAWVQELRKSAYIKIM